MQAGIPINKPLVATRGSHVESSPASQPSRTKIPTRASYLLTNIQIPAFAWQTISQTATSYGKNRYSTQKLVVPCRENNGIKIPPERIGLYLIEMAFFNKKACPKPCKPTSPTDRQPFSLLEKPAAVLIWKHFACLCFLPPLALLFPMKIRSGKPIPKLRPAMPQLSNIVFSKYFYETDVL